MNVAEALEPRSPDALARAIAIAIAAGRMGLGVAILAFTRPALTGSASPSDTAALALARLAGGRDIALGLHGLSARDDRGRLAVVGDRDRRGRG